MHGRKVGRQRQDVHHQREEGGAGVAEKTLVGKEKFLEDGDERMREEHAGGELHEPHGGRHTAELWDRGPILRPGTRAPVFRRGPARPYLLAISAHRLRPSLPPSRTHVLSCARRARPPPRWRQERLFNTLRWRCAAPAVTASCAASRLAERARRSTRHDTAPNTPRLARVLPALCPQSLLLTLSPRVSCAARPHVRRPSAERERSALWWRREIVCH